MRTLLWIIIPILNLLLYIELLIMILTWIAIQYPIKISSILGIWTTNCLIPPTDAEMIGGHRQTRDEDNSLCLKTFSKENLIFTHYMISAWWLHIIYGLVHYVIRPRAIEQVMVITNNIMTLGFTYAKRRLKKPPVIF